jgi:ribosomal protein S15P/S13E
MNKPDIVDVLHDLNRELESNPLLEFVATMAIVKSKIRRERERLEEENKISDTQINNLVSLYQNLQNYIKANTSDIAKITGVNLKNIMSYCKITKFDDLDKKIDYMKLNRNTTSVSDFDNLYKCIETTLQELTKEIKKMVKPIGVVGAPVGVPVAAAAAAVPVVAPVPAAYVPDPNIKDYIDRNNKNISLWKNFSVKLLYGAILTNMKDLVKNNYFTKQQTDPEAGWDFTLDELNAYIADPYKDWDNRKAKNKLAQVQALYLLALCNISQYVYYKKTSGYISGTDKFLNTITSFSTDLGKIVDLFGSVADYDTFIHGGNQVLLTDNTGAFSLTGGSLINNSIYYKKYIKYRTKYLSLKTKY